MWWPTKDKTYISNSQNRIQSTRKYNEVHETTNIPFICLFVFILHQHWLKICLSTVFSLDLKCFLNYILPLGDLYIEPVSTEFKLISNWNFTSSNHTIDISRFGHIVAKTLKTILHALKQTQPESTNLQRGNISLKT